MPRSRRAEQHPFTPAPQEPEHWPGFDEDPHVIRWNPDTNGYHDVYGIEHAILYSDQVEILDADAEPFEPNYVRLGFFPDEPKKTKRKKKKP